MLNDKAELPIRPPDQNPDVVTVVHVEPLNVDDFLVRTLLAIVPTTFRWGTGADCGYELKLKLYKKEKEYSKSIYTFCKTFINFFKTILPIT